MDERDRLLGQLDSSHAEVRIHELRALQRG